MKQNELAPMSAQERKEDIDMLMDSEMMDATVGGLCNCQCLVCNTCLVFGIGKPKPEPAPEPKKEEDKVQP